MKPTQTMFFLFFGVLLPQSPGKETDPTKPPTTANSGFRDLTLTDALKRASREKKVVMVSFQANWCVYSKMLEKTFQEEKVKSWLKKHVVAIKINIDQNKTLVKKVRVNAVPCIVFIKPDGSGTTRFYGHHSPADFLAKSTKALKTLGIR